MRDIFAQRAARPAGPSSAPSSPQQRPKRVHNGPEEDSDVEPLDNNDSVDLDLDLSDDEDAAAKREAMARLKAEKAKRDIRPLRRSASRGGATQSLLRACSASRTKLPKVQPVPRLPSQRS